METRRSPHRHGSRAPSDLSAFVHFLRQTASQEDVRRHLEQDGFDCVLAELPSRGWYCMIGRLEPSPWGRVSIARSGHEAFWMAVEAHLTRFWGARAFDDPWKTFHDPEARAARLREAERERAVGEIRTLVSEFVDGGRFTLPRSIFCTDHLAFCPCVHEDVLTPAEAAKVADAVLAENGLTWKPEPDPEALPRRRGGDSQRPYGDYPGPPWS